MHMGNECLSTYRIRYMKLFMVWAIIIMLITVVSYDLKAREEKHTHQSPEMSLLLNSGSTSAEYANIDLTLWFETNKIPDIIWKEKPMPDWTWDFKVLETTSHNIAISISGQRILDKSQEKDLFKWYTTMAPIIEKTGGEIFLDERVPQAIDVAGYFCKGNSMPAQWILTGNLISVAAYHNNIETCVMAGPDKINVQLVSRGNKDEGQTVLAIPVLLNEF